MNWQILIIISVLTYSVSVILERFFLKKTKVNPVLFSIYFQFVTGVVILAIGILLSGFRFSISQVTSNWLLIFPIFLYAVGSIFIFKALRKTEASKFTLLYSTKVIFAVLASTIVLGEGLKFFEYSGFLVIVAAIIISRFGKKEKFKLYKSDINTLLGALCYGLANTFDRILLQNFDSFTYLAIMFFGPAIAIAIFNLGLLLKTRRRQLKISEILVFGFLCVIYAISSIAFYEGLKTTDNSSAVAVISLSSIVIIVFLSIIFLKERKHIAFKILAVILTIAGLLLIS